MRKNLFTILSAVFFLFAAACEKDLSVNTKYPVYAVRSGTSFGFCQGYCQRELTLTAYSLIYEAVSWQPELYPAKVSFQKQSPEVWSRVTSLANMRVLSSFPARVGCPDCNDGGAEWIEIEQDGIMKRVTFENGSSLEGLEGLVHYLRELRAAQNVRMFP